MQLTDEVIKLKCPTTIHKLTNKSIYNHVKYFYLFSHLFKLLLFFKMGSTNTNNFNIIQHIINQHQQKYKFISKTIPKSHYHI